MALQPAQEQQSNSTHPATRSYARPARSVWGSLISRLLVGVTSAVCLAFLTLPLLALLLRVPIGDLPRYFADPIVLDALRLSLVSSLCSLALMVLLGTPVAYGLARSHFPGKRIVETLVELPLVLPPAVAGVALLFAFGRRTPLGGVLRELNIEVAFTLAAVVMAQAFVAAPFYIKSARAGFQSVPRDLVEVAQTQGAGSMQTFRHIVVPLALPSIAGGAVMGWARAVGEFGATILFAGNFQGRTQTMPLAIYTALETDINAAIVLAGILVVSSFALLITFKLLSGRQLDVVGLGE
ncbi:MAG: ABC transporter permease [Chloroflexota bacterium]|nr:ABC transporter permease [Chloroflexota bacterium]